MGYFTSRQEQIAKLKKKGPQREYVVRWTIRLPDFSMLGAARAALRAMRDPNSTATLFEVQDPDTDHWMVVDGEELER